MKIRNKQNKAVCEMTEQEWIDLGPRQKLFTVIEPADKAPQMVSNTVTKIVSEDINLSTTAKDTKKTTSSIKMDSTKK